MMITLEQIYARTCCMEGFVFQESRVLDILGWPTPGGCSLFHHTTVVERQANYPNDSSRTGRTGSGILADVEEYA
jgi:hypothetical protein